MLNHSRSFRNLLVFSAALTISLGTSSRAHADATRDFLVSCSYGVLAGTMVGAATLAFTDRPGENLNKVARGASLGLYAGILLGAYIVSGGPSADDDDDLPPGYIQNSSLPTLGAQRVAKLSEFKAPAFYVSPVIGEKGSWEGAQAKIRLLEF